MCICVSVCVRVCVCTMHAECCCHVILISVQFSSSMLKLRKVKYNHILKGRKASKVSYMRVRSTGNIRMDKNIESTCKSFELIL